MSNNRTMEALSTAYTTNPGYDVGSIHENGYGDRFMFVKNTGTDTNGVVGKIAAWRTAGARGEVCMDDAESTDGTLGTVSRGAGIFMSAIPFTGFGFIQISGRATVYTDDGVVDADYLVLDGGATQTFIADTAIAGEEHAVFGQAMAADNDTTHLVTAQIWFG